MPNKASAKKRLRQTVKKTTENKNRKTRIKTFVKKVEQAIVQGDQATANEVLKNILNLKNQLRDKILIIDLLNLTFRQANFSKKKNCVCGER